MYDNRIYRYTLRFIYLMVQPSGTSFNLTCNYPEIGGTVHNRVRIRSRVLYAREFARRSLAGLSPRTFTPHHPDLAYSACKLEHFRIRAIIRRRLRLHAQTEAEEPKGPQNSRRDQSSNQSTNIHCIKNLFFLAWMSLVNEIFRKIKVAR